MAGPSAHDGHQFAYDSLAGACDFEGGQQAPFQPSPYAHGNITLTPPGQAFGDGVGLPYAESDEVPKGVSMGAGDSLLANSWGSSSDMRLAADFYREPHMTTRGVSLDIPSFYDDLLQGQHFGLDKHVPPPHLGQKPVVGASSNLAPLFGEGDLPPGMPACEFFKLGVNTLEVSTAAPWEIGIELMNFLHQRCTADVLKPTLQSIEELKPGKTKYSIKALVFVSAAACTLKIKVYHSKPLPAGGSLYSVEFGRRSGDCLAFNGVYLDAARHLRDSKRFEMHRVPDCLSQGTPGLARFEEDLTLPPPLPGQLLFDDRGCPGECELVHVKPLVDTAATEGAPSHLLCECAAAMSVLAGDKQTCGSLCTKEVFAALDGLLANPETAVAYPAAKALRLLKESGPPDSVTLLQDWGPQLVQRAQMAKSSLVSRELDFAAELCAAC